MTAVAVPSAQQIFDSASNGGYPMRPLLQVVEALHTADPVAAVEWLLAVEEDETARCGFQAALDTLRRRDAHEAAASTEADEQAPAAALVPRPD